MDNSGGNLEGIVFFIIKAKGCWGHVLAVVAVYVRVCVCVCVCVCVAMLIDLVCRNKLTSTQPFLT